jgi:hypothetical protein
LESTAPVTVKARATSEPAPELPGLSQEDVGIPFSLPAQNVKSGSTLRITIVRHEDALKIGLSTTDGAVLSQADVPLSQSEVSIQVPSVSNPTTYLIVGTYRHGVGQETVVRRITVTP